MLAVALLLTSVSSPALADSARCGATKLSALSQGSSRLLRCRARAIARSEPVSTECVDKADDRMAQRFDRAQTGDGCAASGELAQLSLSLHRLADDLVTLLDVSPSGARCASGKLKAAQRRTKRELSCRRVAVANSVPLSAACVLPAQDGLVRGFERRDGSGNCSTTDDADAVENLIASFLSLAAGLIDGTTTGAPSGLAAAVNAASIDLTWTAPDAATGFTVSRVMRSLNAAPAGPQDVAAAVVYEGPAETAVDDLTALLPDTTDVPRTYHYAVYGCDSMGTCEGVGSHTTLVPTVVEALRAGGYVIHWRHASANVCSDRTDLGTAATTAVPDWWRSCDSDCGTATARQLNDTGRAEAPAIGAALDSLGIVVGRVLTSEFCRNFETAYLMDFGPVVEETPLITYFVYEEASRCSDTYLLLGQEPAAGTNTALIGHSGNACPPLNSLAWAEAAIFKPDGVGGTTFIERVTANAWLTLP